MPELGRGVGAGESDSEGGSFVSLDGGLGDVGVEGLDDGLRKGSMTSLESTGVAGLWSSKESATCQGPVVCEVARWGVGGVAKNMRDHMRPEGCQLSFIAETAGLRTSCYEFHTRSSTNAHSLVPELDGKSRDECAFAFNFLDVDLVRCEWAQDERVGA